jgi:hypothetical protein
VDATIKKIVENLRRKEIERLKISIEIDSYRRTLSMLGVTVAEGSPLREADYAARHPFSRMGLQESCLMILKDHPNQWLSKTQVEYLLMRGEYSSTAKDPKNSVDITLRRLADDGVIEAKRARGATGNQYKAKAHDVAQSRATNG